MRSVPDVSSGCRTATPAVSAAVAVLVACLLRGASAAAPAEPAASLHDRLAARDPATLAATCRDRGDPRRGAIVFHTSAAACVKCHLPGVATSPLGPDLATIGPDVTDEHVIESILHPSARIRPGYETVTIVLHDGTAVTGMVARQDATRVVLRDATDLERDRVIRRKAIDEIVASPRSLMPDGLAAALRNEQEFYDLARYVMEVAAGGPSRAKALRPRPDEIAVRDDTANLDHAGILRGLGPADVAAGREIFMGHCRNCHGADGNTPTLATARAFGTQPLRFGSDPYAMFLTLSRGNGLMAQVAHLSPKERYQVIHYIREAFMQPAADRPGNAGYAPIDEAYLERLPKGTGQGEFAAQGARDFGPVLAAQLGTDVPNALTFRLADAVTVSYDLHRMRFAGAWQGGFLDLSQTQHFRQRGEHMPLPDGTPLAGLGEWRWGFADRFDIPPDAKPPRGPVRGDWLAYHGHYLHGDRAVLSYAIHGREVLETLAASAEDGLVGIDHALWIAAGPRPVSVAVARLGGPGDPAGLVRPGTDTIANRSGSAAGGIAMVAAGAALETFAAAAVVGDTQGCTLEIDEERRVVVTIPATATDRVVTIRTATGHGGADLRRFGTAVQSAAEPLDPRRLTRGGGPPRWPQTLTVTGILGAPVNGYALDTIPVPFDNPWNAWLRTSALDFCADGRAVVTTLGGDVYIVSGIDEGLEAVTWRRYAAGLFEPLGVRVVNDVVYVTCRDGLKRLHDFDGDGEADFIEAFWIDDDVSSTFHAFNFDLQTDSRGNFYVAQSGQYTERPRPGSIIRVPPEGGTADVVAWGLRTPNGLGILPDDRLTVSDNQGPWIPAGKIALVTPGAFLGNMPTTESQRRWVEERHGGLPESFARPLIWMPQELDNSCGGQLWAADPRWGPLAGRLIHASYGMGRLCSLALQEVDGVAQAAIIALPHQWDAGVMRLRTNPRDGQVYGTGLSGWQGPAGGRDGCLQRLRYAGGPVRFIEDVRVTPVGIDVSFSFQLDPAAAETPTAWQAAMWNYLWSKRYGSDMFSVRRPDTTGTDPLAVESVALDTSGRTARLTIPGIAVCDQVRLTLDVADAQGRRFSEQIHLTINALPR